MELNERERLRHILHELSNLLTGVLVTGGLLREGLRGERLERYAADVCNGGERGAVLLREARALVMVPEDRLPAATEHRSIDDVLDR